MDLPQSIRFRVLEDSHGKPRLAFSPVMVAGQPGIVRVVLHPGIGDGSQSSQRPGIETLDVPWSAYRVAPVAIFMLGEIVPGSLGGE